MCALCTGLGEHPRDDAVHGDEPRQGLPGDRLPEQEGQPVPGERRLHHHMSSPPPRAPSRTLCRMCLVTLVARCGPAQPVPQSGRHARASTSLHFSSIVFVVVVVPSCPLLCFCATLSPHRAFSDSPHALPPLVAHETMNHFALRLTSEVVAHKY